MLSVGHTVSVNVWLDISDVRIIYFAMDPLGGGVVVWLADLIAFFFLAFIFGDSELACIPESCSFSFPSS